MMALFLIVFGYMISIDRSNAIRICGGNYQAKFGGYDYNTHTYYCVKDNKIIEIK